MLFLFVKQNLRRNLIYVFWGEFFDWVIVHAWQYLNIANAADRIMAINLMAVI